MKTTHFDPDRFLYGVLGDVHGDLPALAAAVDAVRTRAAAGGRAAFLFVLGDAIDRGPDSAGCAAFLMRLARGEDPARPGTRLVFVRGDHDLALAWNPDTRTFSSMVDPGDWADALNGLPEGHPDRAVARAWIDFVREAPAAVLLRGAREGALLAHGAVPHADLLPGLDSPEALGAPACDRDFTWCRLSAAPRKIPNRASLFCDVGLEDLADALERIEEIASGSKATAPASDGVPDAIPDGEAGRIPHFIHGHEHTEAGCESVPVRGGRTAWTVTTFRGEGFLGPIRPAVLLLDRAEGEPCAEDAEGTGIQPHAEFAVAAAFLAVATGDGMAEAPG